MPRLGQEGLACLDDILHDIACYLHIKHDIFDTESTVGSLNSNGVSSDKDEPKPDTEVELF